MTQGRKSNGEPRKRILLLAHSFDAGLSMESRLSWFRAVQAAEHYEATVISAIAATDCLSTLSASQHKNLQVVTLPHTRLEQFLKKSPALFYLAYRLWQRRVLKLAKQMHAVNRFDLVHQVSYCGYREPGECWRLEVPFVWGPIGGTQNVPWRFLPELDLLGGGQEALRNCVNFLQLKFSSRVRQALRAAACVISANREVQQALREECDYESRCQLETGLPDVGDPTTHDRDPNQPLRILWAGRLESWKALPLLLKALAKLPEEVCYELRVVGGGSCERRWKRLTRRLGLDRHVQWAGWPIYEHRTEHYQWADCFAFTSLRDTSGTGLLESLAAGVPIVGLDHQGARDIMTEQCAVKISVESPSSVITQLRDAVVVLAQDGMRLEQLSKGAQERAKAYHWNLLAEEMEVIYAESLATTSVGDEPASEDQRTQAYEEKSRQVGLAETALAGSGSGQS